MEWWDQMPYLSFWMLSIKPTFSLSSFIKRLFSSSSLSATRVVSSAYLRLLIFVSAILIPACASSSPAFLLMYSTHKLNKQGDNIQPWCTPFPIWNRSVVSCPVLTAASWPAYRFLKSLNHTKTIPTLHPHPQKNCLPWNWSLVPKSVGSAPLGVPLKRAALILMLWQADYPRGLVGLGGPWPSRLPGLTLWGLLLAVCG